MNSHSAIHTVGGSEMMRMVIYGAFCSWFSAWLLICPCVISVRDGSVENSEAFLLKVPIEAVTV